MSFINDPDGQVPPVPQNDPQTPSPYFAPQYPQYQYPPQQPYYAPYPGNMIGQPYRPTSTLAVVAMVFAFLVPLVGIIIGHVALNQIRKTGEGGHGVALAATILSWVFFGITVFFFIIPVIIGIVEASSSGQIS